MSQRPAKKIRNILFAMSLFLVVIIAGSSVGFLKMMKPGEASGARITNITNVSGTTAALTTVTGILNHTTPQPGLQNPYPPYKGSLVLNDPLRDNSKGYKWEVGADDDGICRFSGGVYHVETAKSAYIEYCKATALHFSHIAYQVQMTMLRGDRGGVVFLVNSAQKTLYYFGVGQDGSYILDYFKGEAVTIVVKGYEKSLIHTGLNESNLVAVVVNGNSVALYVNSHLITRVGNILYSPGYIIGLAAHDRFHATEVVFSNAKVWAF